MSEHAFKHSTALITGSGRRIGASCALALARLGSAVVIHCHGSHLEALALQRFIEAEGGTAGIIQADLADSHEVAALISRAEEVHGRGPVDILVNNAAVYQPGGVRDGSLATWNRHLAVNLTAPFLLMQSFARRLPQGRPGHIIQIIDQHGHRPRPGFAAYSAAKSALWTLTRQAALELAPAIRVNAIGPGPILPAPDASRAEFDRIATATPLERSGSVDDIAAALRFLLENDFITGEMIRVDGGEHLR
ncbi:MAG: SDR family oxidoreductase [Magnetococcales bacterium]|nr:SDR family oxidoreductase [Magnetococcales bacterium]